MLIFASIEKPRITILICFLSAYYSFKCYKKTWRKKKGVFSSRLSSACSHTKGAQWYWAVAWQVHTLVLRLEASTASGYECLSTLTGVSTPTGYSMPSLYFTHPFLFHVNYLVWDYVKRVWKLYIAHTSLT